MKIKNEDTHEQRIQTVVKANDLINKSRFSLTTQQQKIVLYLISQISRNDNDFKTYEFSIAEFTKVCGLTDSGRNYELLKEQIKRIADKSIWINIDGKTETLLRWIEKPYINEKQGTIQIKLDNDMKPYLLRLTENFTEYELIYTLQFKSKYSIRLYEYIKSIHYREIQEDYITEISIEDLQNRLDCFKYTNFKDIHTRVLKPAVNEINEHSDKILNYELISKGRKVIGIRFIISTKQGIDRLAQSIVNDYKLDKKELPQHLENYLKEREENK